MAQLSSVLVQTYDEQGAELLDYHAFALDSGAVGSSDGNLPLTHSFRRLRDSGAQVRVIALGRGIVDGVERTLIETQKMTTVSGAASRQVALFFSDDCFQRFCRTALRGSSLTCERGRCVSVPDGDSAPPDDDASLPSTGPRVDAGQAHDASTDAEPGAVLGMDAGGKPDASVLADDAGCTPGSDGCACADGTLPPCNVAPPVDAGLGCDVGKYVGTFSGAVGTNRSAPDTMVTGTFSFEVPTPGAASTVAIVGSLSGKTPTGNTLVARVDGRWNCGLRSLEQGRLTDGVFTYIDRFINNKATVTGTVTGSYAPSSTSVEGSWTAQSGDNEGGFGTWSARP